MGKVKSMWMDEQEAAWERRRDQLAEQNGLHPDDIAIHDMLVEELEREMEREPIL